MPTGNTVLKIKLPKGTKEGQSLVINIPDGRKLRVVVPKLKAHMFAKKDRFIKVTYLHCSL